MTEQEEPFTDPSRLLFSLDKLAIQLRHCQEEDPNIRAIKGQAHTQSALVDITSALGRVEAALGTLRYMPYPTT